MGKEVIEIERWNLFRNTEENPDYWITQQGGSGYRWNKKCNLFGNSKIAKVMRWMHDHQVVELRNLMAEHNRNGSNSVIGFNYVFSRYCEPETWMPILKKYSRTICPEGAKCVLVKQTVVEWVGPFRHRWLQTMTLKELDRAHGVLENDMLTAKTQADENRHWAWLQCIADELRNRK